MEIQRNFLIRVVMEPNRRQWQWLSPQRLPPLAEEAEEPVYLYINQIRRVL